MSEQNLSLYKIFYIVACTGNISKAAKKLYISQPAISKSINRLEQNLEVSLFTRSSRGVQLTEEGHILFQHVETAFSALESGEKHLKKFNQLGMGHITLGVSTTLCKYILLPYLQGFIECNPHIRISIRCQSTIQTLRLLEENKIDIGLIGMPDTIKQLEFYSLGEIEDIFVAADMYINNLRLREFNTSQDLFQSATLMLLDKENMTRQYIDDYFKENSIEINNIIEITSMDLLIEFARIGLGVACVIKNFVESDLSSKKLTQIPLDIPIHKREIGFAYMKNVNQSKSVKKFIDYFHSTENQQ